MKKFVPENLEEAWVSSDTGIDLYADSFDTRRDTQPSDINDRSVVSDDDILSIIPPANIKFRTEDFAQYITELIEALPENPVVIFKVFQKTLEKHPYLTVKPIGFRGENPYEPYIRKFSEVLSQI